MARVLAACAVAAQLSAGAAFAQASYTTGFEPPEFTAGDVNGQQGWGHISNSPTKGVIEPVPGGSPSAFGAQLLALRTRDVGLFGVSNHLYSATVDPAGETGSTAGGAAVASPRNHFAASFYYRTPSTPVASTRADGRFAELNPSSKGAGADAPANRYAQVRVVNVNNTGNLRFEIGWYRSGADVASFCVQTVAQNLTWGAWYRLDYDILFFDGLNGTRPNDVFRLSVYDLNNNLVGTSTGSTWETAWKTGGFGGGTTPRAVNGFDLWSQTGPNDALVGLIDDFSMATETVVFAPAGLGSVKISEYRLRGPGGAQDEFVELYNNTDAAIIVSDPTPPAGGAPGWAVVSSDSPAAAKFVVPDGTVIPARGHYLAANSNGYSLGPYPAGYGCNVASTATPDGTYAADIPDLAPGACAAPFVNGRGLALFRTANQAGFNLSNRLDAAGSVCETDALFKEGAGHAVLNVDESDAEHSWFRKEGLATNGRAQDSGANAADFLFADTAATNAGAGRRLGAPGPQNLSAPVERADTLVPGLIDPQQPAAAPPNRVREHTSDPANNSPQGTLTIRRRYTNNTGLPVTRLRFRVIDITTYPSPGGGTADMRVRSSADEEVTLTGGAKTTARGTTLETPPAQPSGGGFNSTLSAGAVTLASPLAPGATIDLQWRLGVVQTGNFRFYVKVEGLP